MKLGFLTFPHASTYTPDVHLPDTGPLPIVAPPSQGIANMAEAMVEAQPNPAKQQTEFRYHLPDNSETGQITVTDLNGRIIAQFNLTENIGSVTWDIKSVDIGVYLYKLSADKKTLITKRLVIVR